MAASPFRGFAFRGTGPGPLMEQAFDTIVDIDVRGSNLALLGGRRDGSGKLAPDGALVWQGSLSSRLRDLKPIYFSPARSGEKSMGWCHFLETGVVNFLQDGRLFLVPGVEPGALLYDTNGRLIRSWPTDHLNFVDRCPFDYQQSALYARDYEARLEWLRAHRTVDDALELKDGPAVIVRKSSDRGTTWSLLIFQWDGKTREVALPLKSDSRNARIRADQRGSAVAFLVIDAEVPGRKALPSQVLIGDIR
ncbi:MAG: hypothetical protein ABI718_17675 [Acidobacteriota bacterium]